MKLLLLCQLAYGAFAEGEQPFASAAGTLRVAMDIMDTTFSWATKSFGMVEQCPYVDDPVASLMQHLPASISGQDQGIEMILDTFSSWEFSRKAGYQQPLVLAITGPTGVGKSETGFIIAEAILAAKSRIGVSRRHLPEGYLVLGGQDYSNTSDAFVGDANGLPEVHRRINLRITDHLRKCGGSGVIVFDEIQKVVPGTMDILIGGLKERGEFRVFSGGQGQGQGQGHGDSSGSGSGVEVFSSQGIVFILTSDIGAEEMETLLLAYEDRTLIPQQILRAEVKKALDRQWERLHFGSVVSEVIPFLPLEQLQIEQIMTLKLKTMSAEYRNMYWWDLCIEQSVIQALSRPPFLQYRRRTVRIPLPNGSYVDREKTVATYGARGIDNGGPIQDLKTKMFKYMQPWKKGSILYITSKGFDVNKKTRQNPEILMIWCTIDISMKRPQSSVSSSSPPASGGHAGQAGDSVAVGNSVVLEKHLKSPLCEERWRGTLLDRDVQ